jgi:hypothetical protein
MLIAKVTGAVQRLMLASSKVVAKERAMVRKVGKSLGAFDAPDCLAPPPPPALVHLDTSGWTNHIVAAIKKVGLSGLHVHQHVLTLPLPVASLF